MPREASLSNEYLHPLIYGDPGAGKTTLATSSGSKVLIIHPPTDSVGSAIRVGHSFSEEVITDWSEMNDVYEYLRHEDHGFKWVWLDSISLAQDELLHSIMQDVVSLKPSRQIEVPDVREYMINFQRLLTWTRSMCALPVHFGMTAHAYRYSVDARDAVDQDAEDVIYMPWVQGKMMPEKMCAYMNIVGFLDVLSDREGNERRVLWTRKRNRFYAKDQFGAFGEKVIDPTLDKMEAIVYKGIPKPEAAKKVTAKKVTVKRKPA